MREALARSYDIGVIEPDIQVVDVNLQGDRHLRLQHAVRDGIPLAEKNRDEVLKHVRRLWGYDVTIVGVDKQTGSKFYQASTQDLAS